MKQPSKQSIEEIILSVIFGIMIIICVIGLCMGLTKEFSMSASAVIAFLGALFTGAATVGVALFAAKVGKDSAHRSEMLQKEAINKDEQWQSKLHNLRQEAIEKEDQWQQKFHDLQKEANEKDEQWQQKFHDMQKDFNDFDFSERKQVIKNEILPHLYNAFKYADSLAQFLIRYPKARPEQKQLIGIAMAERANKADESMFYICCFDAETFFPQCKDAFEKLSKALTELSDVLAIGVNMYMQKEYVTEIFDHYHKEFQKNIYKQEGDDTDIMTKTQIIVTKYGEIQSFFSNYPLFVDPNRNLGN